MNFISLGYFCSTAQELEKIGLRSLSMPFDWCISDMHGVISLIENHFEDFLSSEYLYQDSKQRKYYTNIKYKISFYHDFNEYLSLDAQLSTVQDKYERRIQTFYKTISEPTIFVRYISSEPSKKIGNLTEIEWTEKEIDRIHNLLKSFNPQNEIIFIANSDVQSNKIKIFHVEADADDKVARTFLNKNEQLLTYLNRFDVPEKQSNLLFYQKKQAQKEKLRKNLLKRGLKKIERTFRKQYMHINQYD